MFIPAHIWVSKELIPAEKMLLGEVDALSKRTGWCEASREHFADWLQCTPQNVTYYFNKLEKSGFLKILRIPGKRHKCKVVSSKFHASEGVNGTDGLEGSAGFTPPVNGTDPTRQPGLPEIQLKDNKKYKRKARAKKSSTLEDKTPLVENKSPGGGVPDFGDRPAAKTPMELEAGIRAFYMAHPREWRDGVLENAGGRVYSMTDRQDIVKGFCEWAIEKNRGFDTYSQLNARLQKWFRDQKTMRKDNVTTTAQGDVKPGVYTPPKRLITA